MRQSAQFAGGLKGNGYGDGGPKARTFVLRAMKRVCEQWVLDIFIVQVDWRLR